MSQSKVEAFKATRQANWGSGTNLAKDKYYDSNQSSTSFMQKAFDEEDKRISQTKE